jgi:arylsulfatase A
MTSRRSALVFLLLTWVVGLLSPVAEARGPTRVVLIVFDDLGYGDVGCYRDGDAAERSVTPALDRLAREGLRATDFYVAQPVCSASRAAILTGCYPNRVGISGALGPASKIGLAASETTVAEICASRGYATAILGKWHLGDAPEFLPTRQGFGSYFGIPYSNDMWPHHPDRPKDYPPLPIYENERVIDESVDATEQATLTGEITRRAVAFIGANASKPFFLYVAHPMPHVPLFTGAEFKGRSGKGTYGDVLTELDHSIGAIAAELDRHGIADDTLFIVLSDNGPWLSYGDHAGSAGPLREGKGTTWEGGVRVPLIARWPRRIPAGSIFMRPAMAIDLLPTIAAAIEAPLSSKVDGRSLLPWWTARGESPQHDPHEAIYFYYGKNNLEAMRSGQWKLHFPHRYATLGDTRAGSGGTPARYADAQCGLELYDLANDLSERTNVADRHPDVVARMTAQADLMRKELGDDLTKVSATEARPPGSRSAAIDAPKPPSSRP